MSTSLGGQETTVRGAISQGEAAALMGVKPETLATWRSRGQGPAYVKMGRIVRYLPADIEAWIESQRHEPKGVQA